MNSVIRLSWHNDSVGDLCSSDNPKHRYRITHIGRKWRLYEQDEKGIVTVHEDHDTRKRAMAQAQRLHELRQKRRDLHE